MPRMIRQRLQPQIGGPHVAVHSARGVQLHQRQCRHHSHAGRLRRRQPPRGQALFQRIAAEILGGAATPWDARGHCFVEHGDGRAAKASFDFLTAGGPTVNLSEPTAESFFEKQEFERTRLAAWFE